LYLDRLIYSRVLLINKKNWYGNHQPGKIAFAMVHADSETALDTWYRITKAAKWQNLVELREAYPSADLVGIYTMIKC
jgi:HigB_toxin, RelE-like toxic component of a toxin-antitoxin system